MEKILNLLINEYEYLKQDEYIENIISELFYQILKNNSENALNILFEIVLYLEENGNDILYDYYDIINEERYLSVNYNLYNKNFLKIKNLKVIKNFYKNFICKE